MTHNMCVYLCGRKKREIMQRNGLQWLEIHKKAAEKKEIMRHFTIIIVIGIAIYCYKGDQVGKL